MYIIPETFLNSSLKKWVIWANLASMADRQEAHNSLHYIHNSIEDQLKQTNKKTADINIPLYTIWTSPWVGDLCGRQQDNINEYCSCTEDIEKQLALLKENIIYHGGDKWLAAGLKSETNAE